MWNWKQFWCCEGFLHNLWGREVSRFLIISEVRTNKIKRDSRTWDLPWRDERGGNVVDWIKWNWHILFTFIIAKSFFTKITLWKLILCITICCIVKNSIHYFTKSITEDYLCHQILGLRSALIAWKISLISWGKKLKRIIYYFALKYFSKTRRS